jgi:hypothetical protein
LAELPPDRSPDSYGQKESNPGASHDRAQRVCPAVGSVVSDGDQQRLDEHACHHSDQGRYRRRDDGENDKADADQDDPDAEPL